MTVIRPQGDNSAARARATDGARFAGRLRRRGSSAGLATALAVLVSATGASAVVFSGPSYTPPNGGSCVLSGNAKTTGGATWTCTVPGGAYSNLYVGIKNNNVPSGTAPIGESMDSNQPSGSEVFAHSSTGATTIVYTGSTPVFNALTGAFTTAFTRLTLTFSGSGAMVTDATTIALSNANGAVHSLWRTTATNFTVNAQLQASDSAGGPFVPALEYFGTTLLHGKNTRNATDTDLSHVDIGFYYSHCGDGTTDTSNGAEQCDQGSGVNGTAGSCCSSTCSFKPNGTACTDDGNVCTNDQCNGSSPTCQHPNNSAPCNDGTFCNGADTCSGGSCGIHAGNPCPGPDGDGNCAESCNEGADNCTAPDPLGSVCTDGLFCNGADTCSGGACIVHTGNPCPGADGDTNCSESCDEAADDCFGADPDGTSCRPAAGTCDQAETCASGACPADQVKLSGAVCNVGSGDICDPDEVCDGLGVSCPADTVSGTGTTCRTGSGDLCDPDEACTGVADAPCPADVVESTSTVCRSGSGDVCDPDETCTGTPGETCPADVVEPPSTVCRPGSGDVCDPDELCPGVAAGTCAADVVLPASTVCNPGSGDVCDPDELCPGSPGGSCATDVVAPASTVCRGAVDLCDAAETCTGTADTPCPADAKEPTSTVCRPAADGCDVAEQCDGSSDSCPTDGFQPDDTPCSDGMFCNGAETCQSGVCADAADPCSVAAICNESTDVCQTDICPATPQTCRTAAKSLLLIKNKDDDSKDKLIWKFIKGEATTQPDFADPTDTAAYALCIYAGSASALAAQVHVAPGANWSALGTKGYKYKDQTFASDGTQKVILKGTGVAGKTKALLVARGANAPDPIDAAALPEPVTAQLFNYETGICWQGTYAAAIKNSTSLYKAKQ